MTEHSQGGATDVVNNTKADKHAVETAMAAFMVHRNICKSCQKFRTKETKTLSNLCHRGVILYKSFLKSEQDRS